MLNMNQLQYDDWYRKTTAFLQKRFGRDYKLVAALLAATSPQVHVATSWGWTMQIYEQFKAGRKPGLSMLMRCHRANVKRALAGEELSGSKVKAFYQALIGDEQAVVIDTWMLKLFKWYERRDGQQKRFPSDRQYERLAGAFRRWSNNIGIAPARLQAELWTRYRLKNGFKPSDYVYAGRDMNQLTFNNLYIPF